MLSRHSVGTQQGNELSPTRQGTLGHSRLGSLGHCGLNLALKSGIGVRELISIKKKILKAQAGNE